MADLEIVVGKYLEGISLQDSGAIGDIIPLGETAGDAGREYLNVVIPVGDSATPRTFSLPAGDYMVQARLPSGETLSKRVKVTEGDNERLVLRGKASPNEWLSWQNYFGNAPSPRELESLKGRTHDYYFDLGTVKGLEGPGQDDPIAKTIAAQTFEMPRPEIVSLVIAEGMPDQTLPFYERLSEILDLGGKKRFNPEKVVELLGEGMPPGNNAQAVAGLIAGGRWESRPGYQQLSLGSDHGPWTSEIPRRQPHERVYLVARQGKAMWLSMLPLPWRNMRTYEFCRTDITFRAGDSGRVSLNVLVRDTTIASLLGYLGSGDMTAANTLLKEAKHYLFGKTINPFSAAAGGIVLVADRRWRGTGEERDPNWRNWIRNLANWFPWLPDGRILHAWMFLLGGTKRDMTEARKHLLHAAGLGLPAYTESMRLLLEGLKLFSLEARGNDSVDEEVDAALLKIEPVATRLDIRQTFATVELARSKGT